MSFFKFLKPFPILQNISLPTTQNKGRFGFAAFQTFTRKPVKSNGEAELLVAMLSKESTAKIVLTLKIYTCKKHLIHSTTELLMVF